MSHVSRYLLPLMACLALVFAGRAEALTAEQAYAMAAGDVSDRADAINRAVAAGDPDGKTAAFLQALADDAVKYTDEGGKTFVLKDEQGYDPVTGAQVAVPDDAEDVINNNFMRSAIDGALAAMQLSSPDAAKRAAAVDALAGNTDETMLPLVEQALAKEADPAIKAKLALVRAGLMLSSSDKAKRLAAVEDLAASHTPDTKTLLSNQLSNESDPDVKAAIARAISGIDAALAWGDRLGTLFTGVSLASILLLAALGLAITYGLMGVINMAHGELIMIGAYATYVVQGLFQKYLPAGAFGGYLVAAVPVSFAVAGAVGAVMERLVLRHLYGRPLETLLATWGISLILMQAVRTIFGAQNVQVENPSWMSGGVAVLPNLTLPWNRLVIIVFAVAVLAAVAWLIARTRLGLFVRGVTQNRPIASCMGVNTAAVDTWAFALGSGIAGLAGCALSQVGNVGPDLGRGYIVDSFLVVVLGGVGQLAGTVYAALGLGIVNKLLEDWSGAVLAKIAVLALIIIVIQKRPQGLFAPKGRV